MKKEQKHIKSLLRPYFTLLILAVFVIISSFSWGVAHWIDASVITTPTTTYIVLISMILGGAATAALTQLVLDPVLRLNEALREVASGNFSIRLKSRRNVKEIQQSFDSFNAMVEALAATDTLQADFVSNVSHEFKTPINAIEGYAMLLQGDAAISAEQSEYIDKILFNTRRLSDLVGNILLLSKVENQTVPVKKTAFRLDEQIRMAIVGLEHKWSQKNLEPDAELDEIRFFGNEQLLLHVWMNLIDNAVKFSPQGGTVRLQLKRGKAGVQFAIEDQGPGISEHDRARIFDKFYQSESSHAEEGSGLGLALVKRIVDVHGGRITVENRPEGGCRFTVFLPE